MINKYLVNKIVGNSMFKLYSLEEANKMIPEVSEKVSAMQDLAGELHRLQNMMDLERPSGIDALNIMQEIRFLAVSVQEGAAELNEMGAYIKNLEEGIVDFPSQLGAEVVRLCWQQGQDSIQYYCRINDDYQYSIEEGDFDNNAYLNVIPTETLSGTEDLTQHGASNG